MWRDRSRIKWIVVGLICFGWLFLAAVLCQVQFRFIDRISSVDTVPQAEVALILGASVLPDGAASPGLVKRLETGIELYETGRVNKLMITGDDGQFYSDEIQAMYDVLFAYGVDPEDILFDGHGYRTYESCRRAKYVYGIDQAILVTQRFHLSRALFLCEQLGIQSFGVIAPPGKDTTIIKSTIRDLLASVKAYIDIYLVQPEAPIPSVANQPYQQAFIFSTSTNP